MTPDNTMKESVRLTAQISGYGNIPIGAGTRFQEDLGMDSLSMIDLVAAAEKHFSVKIPDEAIAIISCVDDLVKVITNESRA